MTWFPPPRGYYSAACKHGIMYGECKKCEPVKRGKPPTTPASAVKEDK